MEGGYEVPSTLWSLGTELSLSSSESDPSSAAEIDTTEECGESSISQMPSLFAIAIAVFSPSCYQWNM